MKLLVVDGNSILNRAFYGIKLLSTKDGHYTNGIYGFLNILLKLKEEIKPNDVAIAFDVKAKTFRHEMFDGYKATRKPMPPELAEQMPVLKDLLRAMGYRLLEAPGYEADDILGTLAQECRKRANECVISTGDRDSLQLVDPHVSVYLASTKMGRPETTVYTVERIRDEYGISPTQFIDIKALMGDSSDNIPGVAGVGEKTAFDLITRFGTLDYIYENLESLDIKAGVRAKLESGKDMAYLSRKLAEINCGVPIENSSKYYEPENSDNARVSRILASLEMFKMIDKLALEHLPPAPAETQTEAISLNFVRETDPKGLLEKLHDFEQAYFTVQYDQNGEVISIFLILNCDIVMIDRSHPDFGFFFKTLLESPDIDLYTNNSKALYKAAMSLNIILRRVAFDAAIAAYTLNPSANDYALSRLAAEYGLEKVGIRNAPPEYESKAEETAYLPLLSAKLLAQIETNGQHMLLHEIELPLSEVLADMERTGFKVDAAGIETFGKSLEAKIGLIQDEIYSHVGFSFNLNSPKQLGSVLFETLGLPCKKKTKTGYSTDAEVLESLINEHPVIELLLEYRQLSKLKSTYCDGLLKLIGSDGRIRSTFNQTETRTGRISSTEPNLQNIPVRQELGRELRRYFCAGEGRVLIDADYSQIELRVLAHIADDKNMIEAFNNHQDIHAITASQVFHVPLEMVNSLMRSRAKAVNFGIVYGIGAFSLSKDIHVTRSEADHYIKDYLALYSGVNAYMEKVVRTAKETGYVSTMFGRRRYLPELSASNANTRNFGERVARNMPIQGTAADIIKMAMIRVYRRLKQENLTARLILQVHDELIIEAPEHEAEAVSRLLKEEMENACRLNVELTCDVHDGKTWYEAKEGYL